MVSEHGKTFCRGCQIFLFLSEFSVKVIMKKLRNLFFSSTSQKIDYCLT